MFSDLDKEIEHVRSLVQQRFPVYETRVTPQAVQFLVTVDPATMEQRFDELRLDLVPQNYIPSIRREGGEHVILIQRRPPQRFVGSHVNLVLLLLTIATTTWAGAINWAGYDGIDWLSAEAFAKGSLFFTLPLLAILSIHEMGHYVMARKYGVHASLPFFLPAPGTFLGTFGAMISMRDPMPNRKALIDIGAAGPVLGLVTAIPITLLGLALMGADPRPAPVNAGGGVVIQLPFLYVLLSYFLPIPQDAILHPTAFAGWVGLFVTALNLLPAGQLDGGHVARAVLGDHVKYLSYVAISFMFVLSYWYFGWFIIAVFILLLGARHPPPLNDLTKLDGRRQILAAGAASVLLLSFVAIPLAVIPPVTGVEFTASGDATPVQVLNATVTNGTVQPFTFSLANGGNVKTNVTLTFDGLATFEYVGLFVTFSNVTVGNRTAPFSANQAWIVFSTDETANVTLSLNATGYILATGLLLPFTVKAHAAMVEDLGVPPKDVELTVNLRVVP